MPGLALKRDEGFQSVRRETGRLIYEMESGSEAVGVLEKRGEQKRMHSLGAQTSKTFTNKGLPVQCEAVLTGLRRT